jgi:hypothetical protein
MIRINKEKIDDVRFKLLEESLRIRQRFVRDNQQGQQIYVRNKICRVSVLLPLLPPQAMEGNPVLCASRAAEQVRGSFWHLPNKQPVPSGLRSPNQPAVSPRLDPGLQQTR